MNIDAEKLQAYLSLYKERFLEIHHDEIYKWTAVGHFQKHWNVDAEEFPEMLSEALGKTKNLLAATNFFPRAMIIEFANYKPEVVRRMFRTLFDEELPLLQRITSFIQDSDVMMKEYKPDTGKNHFQNYYTISVYLFLRYPNQYYVYKYQIIKTCAEKLKYPFLPSRGSMESVQKGIDFDNEIRDQLAKDEQLVAMSKNRLSPDDDPDDALHILTVDVAFFIGRNDLETSADWWPSEEEYNPGISEQQWSALLMDRNVFNDNALQIMKCFLELGGAGTCKQFSEIYGNTPNFYNGGSVGLAKRVYQKTNCPLPSRKEDSKWWPILFTGRHASSETQGSYIWKLRPELERALRGHFMNSSPDTQTEKDDTQPVFWKMSHGSNVFSAEERENFLQKKWIAMDIDTRGIGTSKVTQGQSFTEEMKDGDYFYLCFGNQIQLLGQIVGNDCLLCDEKGKGWYRRSYKMIANVIEHASYNSKEYKKWWTPNSNSTCIRIPNGEVRLFEEWILLPYFHKSLKDIMMPKQYKDYTKENFLSDVFMNDTDYEKLHSLLTRKQNVILQGPPGVGKTYAAKRLAYSILGSMDDAKIATVQFHQNYSYEDFVMGYRPNGHGFELRQGLFYTFSKKAERDPGNPYFMIIDEINRGNLSKIFGELLMLIEKDYRGTQIILPYNGEPFSVPKNLYIVGMMNTADRSLAMIDYALRRRFSFFTMRPAFDVNNSFQESRMNLNNSAFDRVINEIVELNKAICADDSLGEGFCIGHSYFCNEHGCCDDHLDDIIEYDIIPTLKEYWFDDLDKVKEWENKLQGALYDGV